MAGRRAARHKANLARARSKRKHERERAEIRNAGIGFAGKVHKTGKAVKRASTSRKRAARRIRGFLR